MAVYVKNNFNVLYFGRLMGVQRVVMGISTLAILGMTKIPKVYPELGFCVIFITFMAGHVIGFGFPVHGLIKAVKQKAQLGS